MLEKRRLITMIIIIILLFSIIVPLNKAEAESEDNVSYVESLDGFKVPVPKGFQASPYEDEQYVNGAYTQYKVTNETEIPLPTGDDGNWTYVEDETLGFSYYKKIVTSYSSRGEGSAITLPILSKDGILEIEWFGYTRYGDGNLILPTLTDEEGSSQIIETFAYTSLGSSLSASSIWLKTDVRLKAGKSYVLSFPEFYCFYDSSDANYLYIKNIKQYDIINDIEEPQGIYNEKNLRTKSGGFVIYQTENELENVIQKNAKKSYNQWVWIPVSYSELDNICDSTSETNVKKLAQGYSFSATQSSLRTLNEPHLSQYVDRTKTCLGRYINYITKNEFYRQEHEQYKEVLESIEKYGRFYVSRYELSNLDTTRPTSRAYITPTTKINWYNMYINIPNIADETFANSTMIYEFTFDYILYWLTKTEEKRNYDIVQSRGWGNYYGLTLKYTNLSGSISTKSSTSDKIIPTGSIEYTKANNIYDIAGNVAEWTQSRYYRGSPAINTYLTYEGADYYGSDTDIGNPRGSLSHLGSRAILYI